MVSRAHLDENGLVAAGQAGRRRISPRRLAAVLGQKEPRPVPSRGQRGAADVAIAAVATIVALVVAIEQFRTARPAASAPARRISPWALLGVALTTAPLAFRRTYPITAFCVILVAIIATSGNTHTVITFASVIFAAYCAAAYSPFRRLALLGVLAAGDRRDGGLPGHLAPGAGALRRAAGAAADGGRRQRDPYVAPPGRRVRRAAAPGGAGARGRDPPRASRRSGPASPARCTTW